MSRCHVPELTLHASLNNAVSHCNYIVSVTDKLKSAQQCWNDTKRGKMNYPVTKPVPVQLCQPHIPHGLNRD